jgi:hypothetical protein
VIKICPKCEKNKNKNKNKRGNILSQYSHLKNNNNKEVTF